MSASQPAPNVFTSAVFVRHDLMVEMGRLESLMDTASGHDDESSHAQVEAMRQRHGKIAEALMKIPA